MRHIKARGDIVTSSLRIAVVVSQFNEPVTQQLLSGALSQLEQRGISAENIVVIEVPGAVEIPLATRRLLQSQPFSAALTLGAVIRGETSHYDYVCQMVSTGVQQISLDLDIPVIFGVLTTENLAQAEARLGGNHGHKGKDAADAALDVLEVFAQI